MSAQENMVREWSLTLMAVINGLVLASESLVNAEGSGAVVKVSFLKGYGWLFGNHVGNQDYGKLSN